MTTTRPPPRGGATHRAPGGGGGAPACQSDAICYSGPPGTEEHDPCHTGCEGDELLACEGEVLPSAPDCTRSSDADCDGISGCSGDPAVDPIDVPKPRQGTAWGQAIAADRQGNGVVVGIENAALDTGEISKAQMFITKVDYGGNQQGKGVFGGDQARTVPWSVAVDSRSGRIFCTGEFNGEVHFGGQSDPVISSGVDFFMAEFAPDLQAQWAYSINSSTGTFYQSRLVSGVDADGNLDRLIVGAEFDGTVQIAGDDYVANTQSVIIARFAPDDIQQEPTWTRQIGSSGSTRVRGLALDSERNVVVAGYFDGTIDLGFGSVASLGFDDIFVVKLSGAEGTPLWGETYGGIQNQHVTSVALSPQGDVLLSGGFRGTLAFDGCENLSNTTTKETIFVAKLSGGDGSCLWSKQADQGSNPVYEQRGEGIAVDGAGQVVVAGTVVENLNAQVNALCEIDVGAADEQDAFIAKLSPEGECLWQQRRGGPGLQGALGLALDPGGNLWPTGFDGDDMTAAHAFIVRHRP